MWLAILSVIFVPTFPEIRRLSQLRRDPHMLGLVSLALRIASADWQPDPRATSALPSPLVKRSGRSRPPLQPGLIIPEDLPVRPGIPPQSLCPRKMIIASKTELRRKDNLYSNALLLTRLTGIRIGECIHLPLDCLRQIGPEQWALHVPLGKLHTERLVPLDSEGLRLLTAFLNCVLWLPPGRLAKSEGFLLPRVGGRFALFQMLRLALADFAKRAGCADTSPISPHRLRHTWASEMLRCGIGCQPS